MTNQNVRVSNNQQTNKGAVNMFATIHNVFSQADVHNPVQIKVVLYKGQNNPVQAVQFGYSSKGGRKLYLLKSANEIKGMTRHEFLNILQQYNVINWKQVESAAKKLKPIFTRNFVTCYCASCSAPVTAAEMDYIQRNHQRMGVSEFTPLCMKCQPKKDNGASGASAGSHGQHQTPPVPATAKTPRVVMYQVQAGPANEQGIAFMQQLMRPTVDLCIEKELAREIMDFEVPKKASKKLRDLIFRLQGEVQSQCFEALTPESVVHTMTDEEIALTKAQLESTPIMSPEEAKAHLEKLQAERPVIITVDGCPICDEDVELFYNQEVNAHICAKCNERENQIGEQFQAMTAHLTVVKGGTGDVDAVIYEKGKESLCKCCAGSFIVSDLKICDACFEDAVQSMTVVDIHDAWGLGVSEEVGTTEREEESKVQTPESGKETSEVSSTTGSKSAVASHSDVAAEAPTAPVKKHTRCTECGTKATKSVKLNQAGLCVQCQSL